MSHLRQTEPKRVSVADYDFYIKPFPAFKAANITGELASTLTPLLSALAPLVEALDKGDSSEKSLMDLDINDAKVVSSVSGAFEGISGNRIETLLRKLLIANKNIAVELPDQEGHVEQALLDEDLANELFCGELQDMFILAFEVVRLNYNGFFKKIAGRFGKGKAVGPTMESRNMEF